jgi:hypothetical protein
VNWGISSKKVPARTLAVTLRLMTSLKRSSASRRPAGSTTTESQSPAAASTRPMATGTRTSRTGERPAAPMAMISRSSARRPTPRMAPSRKETGST